MISSLWNTSVYLEILRSIVENFIIDFLPLVGLQEVTYLPICLTSCALVTL